MRKPLERIRDARRHPKLESHFTGLDSPLRPEICPGYNNSSAVIENTLYWSAPASLGEANYLVAVLNSETARARVEAYHTVSG
jgi:hypothetical protein